MASALWYRLRLPATLLLSAIYRQLAGMASTPTEFSPLCEADRDAQELRRAAIEE